MGSDGSVASTIELKQVAGDDTQVKADITPSNHHQETLESFFKKPKETRKGAISRQLEQVGEPVRGFVVLACLALWY